MKINWTITDSYIIGKTNDIILQNKKVASFDLDDTLVKTNSGNVSSDDENDWSIYNDNVVNKLNGLKDKGYHLVIVSNQSGISKGKVDINVWKKKIENIINHIKLDFTIICALKDDMYRKPKTKLWDEFVDGDKKSSFYCGDAGGLPKRKINNIEYKKDFSDTDYKFALNLGIKYLHRDEFVLDVKNVKPIANYPVEFSKIKTGTYTFTPNKPEMIINVGFPASGKSYYSQRYVLSNDYEYINQDTLRTKKKCLMETEKLLKKGVSVIIDNTNMSKADRKEYLDMAKRYNIQCRCLLFTTPKEVCIHNSHFRNFTSNNQVAIIPQIVYNIMNKKYEKPDLNEGFYKIDEIEFNLKLDQKDKQIYEKYYY